MDVIAPETRLAHVALALGPALVARAEATKRPQLTASLVRGSTVVLGAAQRAGRVLDFDSCAHAGVTILRRTTTGTAAWLGGRAFVFTLALPAVATLFPDATPRTLLNRNIRPFLKGFARAGLITHYFGRDFLAMRQRPGALIGFDVSSSGAVLIELFVGYDEPATLPDAVASHDERALERWKVKRPTSLAEMLVGARPMDIANAVLEGFAERAGEAATSSTLEPDALDTRPFRPITSPLDPVPEDLSLGAPVVVPIGWVEAAVEATTNPTRRVWLGGDMLAPRFALQRIAERAGGLPTEDFDPEALPLEGATLADLMQAIAMAIAG